ncbi:GDP-mannose 4,6-dehydratase [Vibrio parahaemolyticus]|uniref:GDP-mannose 4,6-dehydratase n=1 Tax=Vibrio parahaemolyticus TaxID=670 RepID=UPI001A33B9AE|nr:GDP-mannose 4,6-dehydratase [Vibrio parahaemolyticus]EGR2229124.1 GDP-mannose 4,6-dehydratase [Vibrio parahaemolyticus]EJG2010749.1 GDP-mannose 4,6-dehydratase [Vibrio parahaemolyticus]EJU8966623.1 GDP-mannose 4,6-dehydratase [Vibrio parahaemolyticus]HCD1294541.1 GDP-mannose 4,6-dehydratase [Vibrio parahaemolyticus]
MNKKVALVCGVSGQDGALLARFLLSKNYVVYGTSRDAQGGSFSNLKQLGINQQVELLTMAPEDFRSVYTVLKKTKADEVYYLAGQSSVGLSFELPAETIQGISLGILNMLEACRLIDKKVKIYHAGSSECFGDTNGMPATEESPFKPKSPYAVAKSSAFWLVDTYRDAYQLFACTGILFNHESNLRPKRFVTQKIIESAIAIYNGSTEPLKLGRLDVYRDWGCAEEYVEAMWRMLQQDKPQDFVIATGKTYSLEAFVDTAFSSLGLDWKKHVIQSKDLFRPSELLVSSASPQKAKDLLGWQAKKDMRDVVLKMIESKLSQA